MRALLRPPPPQLIRFAARLVAALLVPPVVVVAATGDGPLVVVVALAMVAALLPAASLPPGAAAGLSVVTAATMVAAVLAPSASVLLAVVAGATLIAARVGRLHAGVAMLLPFVALVAGVLDPSPSALAAGVGGAAGGAIALLVARGLDLRVPAVPTPAEGATVYAVVLTIAVTVASVPTVVGWLPRGYWVPLTVLVILVPDADQSRRRLRERALGTLAGGLVATGLVLLLPAVVVVVVAVALLVLQIAWVVAGDQFRSVVALTCVVVLLSGAGDVGAQLETGLLRVALTVAGAAVAALAVLVADRMRAARPS